MTRNIPRSIRNITVSGRIGSGTTTLAKGLSRNLGWELLEGGELFERFFSQEKSSDADRPDSFDTEYEEKIKTLLKQKDHQIIQSHLAGFDAQNIPGVFKILVLCTDKNGQDMISERANRLVERKGISEEAAQKEVTQREQGNLIKWRRLYAKNNPKWVYWDKKYYDLIINTYFLNQKQALDQALNSLV